jgi:hypothetical protein
MPWAIFVCSIVQLSTSRSFIHAVPYSDPQLFPATIFHLSRIAVRMKLYLSVDGTYEDMGRSLCYHPRAVALADFLHKIFIINFSFHFVQGSFLREK